MVGAGGGIDYHLWVGGYFLVVGLKLLFFYIDILVNNFCLVRDGKFVLLGTCWLFLKP